MCICSPTPLHTPVRMRLQGGGRGERVEERENALLYDKFSHVTLHVMLGRVWRCRRCGSLVCTLRDERDDGLMVEVHEL